MRPAPTQPPPPPAPALPKLTIEAEDIPDECADLAKLADSPSKNQALSARISLAACLVDEKSRPLVLCDCEQSVNEINAILDPSLELLDDVVAAGEPAMQILARYTQGGLLAGFAQRMLSTVPPPVDSTEASLALRDTRVTMLAPLIQPWLMRAQGAFTPVDKLARENPKLGKNPAVVAAVRTSREKLSQGVANR